MLAVGVIMTLLADTLDVINIFRSSDVDKTLQLTIFIRDIQGNIPIENSGQLVVDLGNDSRVAKIGEDGRTNFGEIPSIFQDSIIKVGFEADDYIIADGNNIFKFTGNPIELIIKKKNNLKSIKGVVRNRSGQIFIENAQVRINNDTLVYTNNFGVFAVFLPIEMQLNEVKSSYNLTISKEGFRTISETYYDSSQNFEVRLDKLK